MQSSAAPHLRSIENAFKTIHEKYPERHLYLPCNLDQVDDLLNEAFNMCDAEFRDEIVDFLKEEPAIDAQLDVACYEHLRYMPAILHRQEFFEVLYVMRGHCQHTVGNDTMDFESGYLCITSPLTQSCVSCFSEDSHILYILVRSTTFLKTFQGLFEDSDLLSQFFLRALTEDQSLPYILFKTGNDPILETNINLLQTMLQPQKRPTKRMSNALLNLIFAVLMEKHESHVLLPENTSTKINKDILYMIRYLQHNFPNVTLTDLSKMFGFSQRQTQRLLKTSTGMNFKDIILQLRMKHACNLLHNSCLSIEQVAEAVGYSDASNFRYAFKRQMAMTPSLYRKTKEH